MIGHSCTAVRLLTRERLLLSGATGRTRPEGGLHWPDLVTLKQSLGPNYGAYVLAPTQLAQEGGQL